MASVDRVRNQGKAIVAFLEDSGLKDWAIRIAQLVEEVDSPLYRERALEELARLTHIQWMGDLPVKYGTSRSDWWKYLERFEIECRKLLPKSK